MYNVKDRQLLDNAELALMKHKIGECFIYTGREHHALALQVLTEALELYLQQDQNKQLGGITVQFLAGNVKEMIKLLQMLDERDRQAKLKEDKDNNK